MRRLLGAAAFFIVLDVSLGMLAHRLLPGRSDERAFRIANDVYHHDLQPNTSAWARWGPLVHRIHTNSLGFKDAEIRSVPLESDAHRVLLLGDSFTEGIGMPFESSFAGLIHAQLADRGIEVLNAAVSSYAPTIYARKVRYLMEDAGLDFDEVVVFLDISDIQDEAGHYALDERGVVVDQSGASEQFHLATRPEPTLVARVKRFLLEHSLTVRVLDTIKDRLSASDPEGGAEDTPTADAESDPLAAFRTTLESERGNWTHDPALFESYGRRGLERAAASMDRLLATLQRAGKPLTLAVYPWPQQVVEADPESRQVRFWRDWAAERDVAFVDLFPVFLGAGPAIETLEALYIPGDYHFNERGNRRVAEAFLQSFEPGLKPSPKARR